MLGGVDGRVLTGGIHRESANFRIIATVILAEGKAHEKYSGKPFGNNGQSGAEFPFVGGDSFGQNLPKTNSGAPDHFGITDANRKITTQVIPGGGRSTHENGQIKPDFVITGGPDRDSKIDLPEVSVNKPILDQTVIHIAVFARFLLFKNISNLNHFSTFSRA